MSRSFEWYVGVDWGGSEHVMVLLDRGGRKHGTWRVPHTSAAVHAFLAEHLTHAGRQDVAVGLEIPRGVIVDALLEQGVVVFALNPKQLDRFRDRHTVAGAKDDRLDAYVIADALRTDPQCFREVQPDPAQVTELREYTRMLEELDRDHRRGANQLREQILRIAPEWLTLSDGADEPWFWALLEKTVRPTGAKPLRRPAVARLLQDHRIRRWWVDEVCRVLDAPRWTPAAGTWAAVHAHVDILLARLWLLHRQRNTCEADLDRLLRRCAEESEGQPGGHRDVTILQSLPGVGRKTAAAMLAYAARHLADRDYPTLRSYLGVAPVTKRSGKRYYVVQMRYACHTRLRTVVHCWASASLRLDTAARRYYDQLRQRGCTHARALRSVGDRWLRILIAMLRTQKTYDPTRLRSAVGN